MHTNKQNDRRRTVSARAIPRATRRRGRLRDSLVNWFTRSYTDDTHAGKGRWRDGEKGLQREQAIREQIPKEKKKNKGSKPSKAYITIMLPSPVPLFVYHVEPHGGPLLGYAYTH